MNEQLSLRPARDGLGPHCPRCDSPGEPGDRFCEACGADLVVQEAQAALCPDCGAEVEVTTTHVDTAGQCAACARRTLAAPPDRMELDLGTVVGVSDRGLRHRRNEDALALRVLCGTDDEPLAAVAVVCDGVSSSSTPEDASRTAAYTAAELLAEAARDDLDAMTATRSAVRSAVEAVSALRVGDDPEPPSCTYVSAVVTPSEVTVGWIGDSRAYWLAAPEPTGQPSGTPSSRLTTDHSWAQQMVDLGQLSEEEAQADRRANALCRWVGADCDGRPPNLAAIRPTAPGWVLLCSDGMWHYLREADDLARLVAVFDDPLDAARALTRLALDGGGHDNITVALVPFPLRETTSPRG
ncbi:serine/threonine protein phosphatase [Actinoalloteichus sp. AHMU CJ021]|uniref:Serine/threonine protein phosphatase PrpC n=2 Tax=Actinoalloteichus cyanogriseus TaxID=2893586 RepID=A0ABT1JBV8_ACTCY|nr:protein phosphatase 2C domain-containing protein [Actinoalloteichus caeruleus]AUS80603.1 serine/threonine protein phosphatase [Actinoalloteichus sp. AHMU CJ021]MCP2329982.1 Serine/threonine protein phosphatase PrpC [Actinoalloteichus caeruleus DSM 43889]